MGFALQVWRPRLQRLAIIAGDCDAPAKAACGVLSTARRSRMSSRQNPLMMRRSRTIAARCWPRSRNVEDALSGLRIFAEQGIRRLEFGGTISNTR
jgi:hypothetical protein